MVRLALAALLLLALATPVAASYIVYYKVFGAWTVLCSRDEPTGKHKCLLQAVPRAIGHTSRYNTLEVAEVADDRFSVTLRVRDDFDRRRAVTLQVGDNPPHNAFMDRFGTAVWAGDPARLIVGEMAQGPDVRIALMLLGEKVQRQSRAPLRQFSNAIAIYRWLVRKYAAIGADK